MTDTRKPPRCNADSPVFGRCTKSEGHTDYHHATDGIGAHCWPDGFPAPLQPQQETCAVCQRPLPCLKHGLPPELAITPAVPSAEPPCAGHWCEENGYDPDADIFKSKDGIIGRVSLESVVELALASQATCPVVRVDFQKAK